MNVKEHETSQGEAVRISSLGWDMTSSIEAISFFPHSTQLFCYTTLRGAIGIGDIRSNTKRPSSEVLYS